MRVSQDAIDLIKSFGYGDADADFLANDLGASEYEVNVNVTVPLTQHQFDALVSYTYDLGADNLKRSELLAHVNAGEFDKAAAFLWEQGMRRREAERALFLAPDTVDATEVPDEGTTIEVSFIEKWWTMLKQWWLQGRR